MLYITTLDSNKKLQVFSILWKNTNSIKIPKENAKYEDPDHIQIVLKTLLSPNSSRVCLLNSSFELFVFTAQKELFEYKLDYSREKIFDFSWWDDDSLVLSTGDRIEIVNIKSKDNLLDTELISSSSKLTHVSNGNFVMLDCEIEEKYESYSDNALYGVYKILFGFILNSSKTIDYSLIYKLLYFSEMKPIDMIQKKIRENRLSEALDYGKDNNINPDTIYLLAWKNSKKDKASIQNFLEKIKDSTLIIKESLESLINETQKRELLNYALKIAQLDDQKKEIQRVISLLDIFVKIQIYDALEFQKFCKSDLLKIAFEFAIESNPFAIELLLNHFPELLDNILEILNHFHPSYNPKKYASLLPNLSNDFNFKLKIGSKELTEWYQERALFIESKTNNIENSIDLLEIGIENEIPNLLNLKNELKVLYHLIYQKKKIFTFKNFTVLNNFDKIKMVISQDKQKILSEFQIIKFYFDNDKNIGKDSLWYQFISYLTKLDSNLSFLIIKENATDFPDIKTLLYCVIDSIKDSKHNGSFEDLKELLEIIPQDIKAQDKEILDLINEIKSIDKRIKVLQIVSKYQIKLNLRELMNLENKVNLSSQLIIQIIKYGVKDNFNEERFKNMFNDLKELYYSKLFHLEESFIHSQFLIGCCESSKFNLLPFYIKKESIISLEESDNILYHATQHLINSIYSHQDSSIKIAQECIKHHEIICSEHNEFLEHPKWKKEKELLDILIFLSSNYDHYKLPIQLRFEKNYSNLILYILEKNKDSYKDLQKLKLLAEKLNVKDVLIILFHFIKIKNESFAYEVALKLYQEKNSKFPEICKEILNFKGIEKEKKKDILVKGLELCSKDDIEDFTNHLDEFNENLTKPKAEIDNILSITEIGTHPFYSSSKTKKISDIEKNTHDMKSFYLEFEKKKMEEKGIKEYFSKYISGNNPEQSLASSLIGSTYLSLKMISKIENYNKISNEDLIKDSMKLKGEIPEMIKEFHQNTLLSSHSNILKKYLPTINIENYSKNVEYKIECIKQMSKTLNEEQFEFALSLTENLISHEELYKVYILYYLEVDKNTSIESNKKIKKICVEKLSKDKEFFKKLQEYVEKKPEFVLELLSIYQPHLLSLGKLISQKFNLLSIIQAQSSEELLKSIESNITLKNIDIVSPSIAKFPFEPTITQSLLYQKIIRNELLNPSKDLNMKLELLEEYIPKLSSNDLISLLNEISKSMEIKNLPTKIQIIQESLSHSSLSEKSIERYKLNKILFKFKVSQQFFINETFEKTTFIWDLLIENKIKIFEALQSIVLVLHDQELINETLKTFKKEFTKIFGKNPVKIPIFLDMDLESLYTSSLDYLIEIIEKNDKMIKKLGCDLDDITEWPPKPIISLDYLDSILKSLQTFDESITQNVYNHLLEYIYDENKNMISRTLIMKILSQYTKVDEKILSKFITRQFLNDYWDKEYSNYLQGDSKDELWKKEIEILIEKSSNEDQFNGLTEIINFSKYSFESMFKKLSDLKKYELIYNLSCKYSILDAKMERELFNNLIDLGKIQDSFLVALHSNDNHNLALEYLIQNPNTLLTQEIIILLIEKGYSSKIVSIAFKQILSNEISILGSEDGDIESQFICELILANQFNYVFEYISKKVYSIPSLLNTRSNQLYLTLDYLKKQMGILKEDNFRIQFCYSLCEKAIKHLRKKFEIYTE